MDGFVATGGAERPSRPAAMCVRVAGIFLAAALWSVPSAPLRAAPVPGSTPLVIVYIPPKKPITSTPLMTPQEVADTFTVVIYHRDRLLDTVPAYKAAGFKGTITQYIILNSFMGPVTLHDATGQTRYCNGTEWNATQWNNHITMEPGDFCRIHDSVVGGKQNPPDASKKFDHDLNPATPAVWATEDWFLHHPDTGDRIVEANQQQYYRPNPGHPQVREYFAARIRREFAGGTNVNGSNHPPAGADALFLDNIELSWTKVQRDGGFTGRGPREYATSTAYADAVFGFVQHIYNATHSGGLNVPVWGNMIEGGDHTDSAWDRYIPLMDGAMNESYGLFWGQRVLNPTEMENQMRQADKWIAAGNHFMAVAQGTTTVQKDAWNRFALAAYLMVTDGNGSYHYDPHTAQYTLFYDYPEYHWPLGRPSETRRRTSISPLIYERRFECGEARLNITQAVGTITYNQGCTPANGTAPTVSLTAPAGGSTFVAPASLSLAATASDPDGSVSKVEFYEGATKLGEDASSPYSYSWTNVPAGSYSLTARAVGNTGAATTSIAVNVAVVAPITSFPLRINAGGAALAGGWQADNAAARSPYLSGTGDDLASTTRPITMDGSVPAGTPTTLFQTERWDEDGGGNMLYSFPVNPGAYEVRLFFADIYSGGQFAGARMFDVDIEGQRLLNDYDIVADVGGYRGVMKSFTVNADNLLTVEFFQGPAGRPCVMGLEVLPFQAQTPPVSPRNLRRR